MSLHPQPKKKNNSIILVSILHYVPTSILNAGRDIFIWGINKA